MITSRSLLALLFAATVFTSCAAPQRPPLTGVAEAAFYTSDMDSSLVFYRDFLGYEPAFVRTEGNDTVSVTFKVNETQLVTILPEEVPDTPRLAWFLLETDDAEGMRKYLKAQGVEVPLRTEINALGNRQFLLSDPLGYRMGFVQILPDGKLARSAKESLTERRVSKTLSHVGFAVYDLEKAFDFYSGLLGLQDIWRNPPLPEQPNVVHMRLPDCAKTLEFLPVYGETSLRDIASKNHICLELEDIYPAMDTLKARKSTENGYRVGFNRKRQANYYDIDGTRVEIMEDHMVE